MSEHNPFAVSDHVQGGGFSGESGSHDLRHTIQLLTETRPWGRLIGILLMIGAVLMVLFAGAIFVMSIVGGIGGDAIGPIEGIIGLVYGGMAFLYVYPALCLLRYGSAITQAESSGQIASVNEAILQQKKFWKFVGVVTVIVFGLYILMILLSIVGLAVG